MAYREFYNDPQFSVADSDYISQGVADLFKGIHVRRQERQKSVDKFEYDLSEGKFENDQKILTELANTVITKGRNEIMRGGRTSNDTLALANQGKKYQQMSKIQFETAKNLQSEILARETKDPYYNSNADLMALKVATNGENGEVNFFDRGKRLEEFLKQIGRVSADPNKSSFKNIDYRQDYVKKLKDQFVEKSSKNANAASSKYSQATFWDEEKGVPGVTPQHAIDYLKSDARVDQYFNAVMDEQLDREIERMKASGDPRVAWMKGGTDLTGKGTRWLDNASIKSRLIQDPSLNIINSKDFGIRKRELAQQDLRKADRVNTRVSYEKLEPKENKNSDGTNDTVAHGSTFIADNFRNNQTWPATPGQQSAEALGVVKPNTIAGPGGNLMTKKGVNPGKPIVTDFSSNRAFNYIEGKNINRPNGKFNLTGYQLTAYDVNGNVVPIGANNTQEMIERINGMRNEDFATMKDRLQIGLKGFTVDQSKFLGDINKKTEKLYDEIAKAEENGDDEKVARLEAQIGKLDGLRNYYNDPSAFDDDLVVSALGAGVKEIRVDQLLMANRADLDKLKELTGLDLVDESKWSPDMKAVNDVYTRKFQEARAAGFKSSGATQKTKAITSDGSDLDSWKTSNEYSVNGSIYYYDKTASEWKKR